MQSTTIAALCLSPLATVSCTTSRAEPAPYVLQPGHIDLARGPDGNTVILDTPGGLVVVDSGRHADHAERVLAHARSVAKPVAAIVNTHWHLDHTTGNRDLRLAWPQAEVIATGAGEGALAGFLAPGIAQTRKQIGDPATKPEERKAAERRLAAVTDRASFLPAVPVVGNAIRQVGGRAIELRVARAAATEADLWLLVPDEKLAIVGDLVVAPAPFFDTGCEEGWRKALDDIAAARWDTLIPGHGAPMTRADFTRWRTAFDGFLECGASSAPSSDCVARWKADAAGFFTAAEEKSVDALIAYYVDQVLRAPQDKRMAYCKR